MNSVMNSEERLNLQNMIKANDVEDKTELIRESRHSDKIKEDVKNFLFLKQKYPRLAKSNPSEFDQMCISKCQFIFTNYTDIFNKIKKEEIDLTILDNFLIVLKKIEEGKIDQHDGSYQIGKLLKEIYIDSALKKSEKLDKEHTKNNKTEKVSKPREISWSEFKNRKAK